MACARMSRRFDFRLGLGLPLILMALLLAFDPTPVDFALERLFYTPGQGFLGRHSFWLEDILHDRAKQAVILIAALTFAGLFLGVFMAKLRAWRRPLSYLATAMVLSTSVVSPLKVVTGMQCPWDVREFGGEEVHVPLLGKRVMSAHPGRCWPGGHAAAGYSLFGLFFLLRDRRPRAARAALLFAFGLGSLFSVGRMMQGAHFLSHNVWTLLIDWTICTLCYRWLLYRVPAETPGPVVADAAPALTSP